MWWRCRLLTMLQIDIPASLYELPGSWDGKSKQLIRVPAIHLELEHSLLSISRWESEWEIPFLAQIEQKSMTMEMFRDYCRFMTVNKQKDPGVYRFLRQKDIDRITDYLSKPMSAHTLRQNRREQRKKTAPMTCEDFYWLMIRYGIPFECEKWPFRRLLALIDKCESKSGNEPPMSYSEKQQLYARLNMERRAALHSKG